MFFFFFFFFFFVPRLGATGPATTTTICKESTCSSNMDSPRIRFPFRLQNDQSEWCGYNSSFDLSCSGAPESQPNLILPSSGEFVVKDINYILQKLQISNADGCFARLFLRNNFSLVGSPFSHVQALVNFTFINCSYVPDPSYVPISCLSKVGESIIGVPSTWYDSETQKEWSSFCSVISTAFVPFEDPLEWENLDTNGLRLAWDDPDCHFCEGRLGNVCVPASPGSKQVMCYNTINTDTSDDEGMGSGAKYGIMLSVIITAMFMFFLTLELRSGACCGRADQSSTVELSAITTNQAPGPILTTGLDVQTIESYPKIRLGEVWELPKPNDNMCPICLSEYKANNVLRGIPECNHYFHVNCVDEWLRRNGKCPLCRNPSDTSNKVVEA